MVGFTLSFRAAEYKRYYDDYLGQVGPDVFAVMLVETPDLPGRAHPEGRKCAVVCACRYKTTEGIIPNTPLWGWVNLDAEAREEIGRDLEKADAEVGRWYYLELGYSREPLESDEGGING